MNVGDKVQVTYNGRDAVVKSVSEATVVVVLTNGKVMYLKHKDVRAV